MIDYVILLNYLVITYPICYVHDVWNPGLYYLRSKSPDIWRPGVFKVQYLTGIMPMVWALLFCWDLLLVDVSNPTRITSHRNGNVVILTKFSSLAALKVVILTTFGAASDENFIKMMTFPFLCHWNWSNENVGTVSVKVTLINTGKSILRIPFEQGPLLLTWVNFNPSMDK